MIYACICGKVTPDTTMKTFIMTRKNTCKEILWKRIHTNMIEQFRGYHSRISSMKAGMSQNEPASNGPQFYRIRGHNKEEWIRSPNRRSVCPRHGRWLWPAL